MSSTLNSNVSQQLGVTHTDWCHNRDLNPDAILATDFESASSTNSNIVA